ncbi:MAG: tRNA pseudouridine(13) synthase TruD [Gemmataceae bacterium]
MLRDIPASQRETLDRALEELRATGLANYFDYQRFGSVHSLEEGFIGLHLVKGQFEPALKLALAGTYQHDPAEAKREKDLLASHWGDWQFLLDNLPRGHARSLVAL